MVYQELPRDAAREQRTAALAATLAMHSAVIE
jgi:hypothetical protein